MAVALGAPLGEVDLVHQGVPLLDDRLPGQPSVDTEGPFGGLDDQPGVPAVRQVDEPAAPFQGVLGFAAVPVFLAALNLAGQAFVESQAG